MIFVWLSLFAMGKHIALVVAAMAVFNLKATNVHHSPIARV
jgi:hypothetical protein